jgi:hypothetical protein
MKFLSLLDFLRYFEVSILIFVDYFLALNKAYSIGQTFHIGPLYFKAIIFPDDFP